MNNNTMELNLNEMEQASGGTFNDNKYKDSEYANVGIRIVSHLIARNEFWWNGQDIGHDQANMVVQFCRSVGRQPLSLEEAIDFIKKPYLYGNDGGCNLLHLTGG